MAPGSTSAPLASIVRRPLSPSPIAAITPSVTPISASNSASGPTTRPPFKTVSYISIIDYLESMTSCQTETSRLAFRDRRLGVQTGRLGGHPHLDVTGHRLGRTAGVPLLERLEDLGVR